MPITLEFLRLPGGEGLPAPRYQSDGAAGLDLHAAVIVPVPVAPGEYRMIPCGIAVAIPRGYEGQVRPRSGLASKHGITLLNSPGTIDSDYRGELKVIVINHGAAPFVVERGARIAQLVICPVAHATLAEVQVLSDTARGEGGFGHTGTA